MVYRIYVEKKDGFDHEAKSLLSDARELLELSGIEHIRIINRYDAEDIEKSLFDACVKTVFSEPQMDRATEKLELSGAKVFAVEYLPGQFDQRADSAAQCIQLVSKGGRPLVRTAKLYAVYGNVTEEALSALKKYVINPVESREASLHQPRGEPRGEPYAPRNAAHRAPRSLRSGNAPRFLADGRGGSQSLC